MSNITSTPATQLNLTDNSLHARLKAELYIEQNTRRGDLTHLGRTLLAGILYHNDHIASHYLQFAGDDAARNAFIQRVPRDNFANIWSACFLSQPVRVALSHHPEPPLEVVINRDTPLSADLVEAYYESRNGEIPYCFIKLLYQREEVDFHATPDSLGMRDGDVVEVEIAESCPDLSSYGFCETCSPSLQEERTLTLPILSRLAPQS